MDGVFVETSDNLETRVIAILAAQALREPEGLRRDMTLDSLGIDSMGFAEILFAIEEAFDVAVPFNANAPEAGGLDLRSVGTVCDTVAALVRDQRGRG